MGSGVPHIHPINQNIFPRSPNKGAVGTYGVFLYEGPLVNRVVRKLLGASCRYSVDSGFIPVDTMDGI